MDQITPPFIAQYAAKQNSIPPAQLWTGSQGATSAAAISFFQHLWCSQQGCQVCVQCRAIRTKQSSQLIWLEPENSYTIADIAIVEETIALQRSAEQPLFFILSKAERLSSSCANSLLKSIEEPPPGYHFILLTAYPNRMLPTILSRCIIHGITINGTDTTPVHDLITFFTAANMPIAHSFLKTVEESDLNEHETVDLIKQILERLLLEYKQAILDDNFTRAAHLCKRLAVLEQAQKLLPMPGSSKLFWKDLFLKMIMVQQ